MNDLTTPTPVNDGWDSDEGDDMRIIQGTLIRCVDGRWSTKDGAPIPQPLVVLTTRTILQRWANKTLAETVTTPPLPDEKKLNEKIPEEEWELSFDGKTRKPPWQRCWCAYAIDAKSMARFTFINSTAGAKIAVNELRDAVKWMRSLRGNNVLPVVELSDAPMNTSFGMKRRPQFKIANWTALGGATEAVPQIAAPSTLPAVKPVTTKEALNDDLPW